jgi:exodeoxyribonuclease V alpha subunit
VPEHIRASTSQPALDVEADLAARLAARNLDPHATPRPPGPLPAGRSEAVRGLDVGQTAAVAALAGDRPLVVVEGAAGAGKTTTLAAARDLLEQQGRRLTVVTPTLKAAQVAAGERGAPAGSAAWLVYQHGWRWDDQRTWTRLTTGEVDPGTGRLHTEPEEGARLRRRPAGGRRGRDARPGHSPGPAHRRRRVRGSGGAGATGTSCPPSAAAACST